MAPVIALLCPAWRPPRLAPRPSNSCSTPAPPSVLASHPAAAQPTASASSVQRSRLLGRSSSARSRSTCGWPPSVRAAPASSPWPSPGRRRRRGRTTPRATPRRSVGADAGRRWGSPRCGQATGRPEKSGPYAILRRPTPSPTVPRRGGGRRVYRCAIRLLCRSHISPGSSSASSKPMPQAGTVLMSSQPSNGVPSSNWPVTHACVSPKAIPDSSVR